MAAGWRGEVVLAHKVAKGVGAHGLVHQGFEHLLDRHLFGLGPDLDVLVLVAVDRAAWAVRRGRGGRFGLVLGGALKVEQHDVCLLCMCVLVCACVCACVCLYMDRYVRKSMGG